MGKQLYSIKEQRKTKKQQLKSEKESVELQLKNSKAKELELKILKEQSRADSEEANSEGMFGSPTEPRKALNSFLRNQNNFEVNAVSIIDTKAAILIRISTAVISGLIVFHEYIEDNVIYGLPISAILLIGLLMALILSILAIKPLNKFVGNSIKSQVDSSYPKLEENTFFMWNSCNLREYEEAMMKVVNSQNLQLGNQIRANFLLARNNSYKATMVMRAYNIFLITFVVAGVLFLISKFVGI